MLYYFFNNKWVPIYFCFKFFLQLYLMALCLNFIFLYQNLKINCDSCTRVSMTTCFQHVYLLKIFLKSIFKYTKNKNYLKILILILIIIVFTWKRSSPYWDFHQKLNLVSSHIVFISADVTLMQVKSVWYIIYKTGFIVMVVYLFYILKCIYTKYK